MLKSIIEYRRVMACIAALTALTAVSGCMSPAAPAATTESEEQVFEEGEALVLDLPAQSFEASGIDDFGTQTVSIQSVATFSTGPEGDYETRTVTHSIDAEGPFSATWHVDVYLELAPGAGDVVEPISADEILVAYEASGSLGNGEPLTESEALDLAAAALGLAASEGSEGPTDDGIPDADAPPPEEPEPSTGWSSGLPAEHAAAPPNAFVCRQMLVRLASATFGLTVEANGTYRTCERNGWTHRLCIRQLLVLASSGIHTLNSFVNWYCTCRFPQRANPNRWETLLCTLQRVKEAADN